MQRVAIGSSLLGFGVSATASAGPGVAVATTAAAEDPRVRVIATLGDEQPATPRATAAMRELIEARLDDYDAAYLELAPRVAVLRVGIVDEPDGTQGFYGVLRLERGADAVEAEVSCSQCGGSGFLAALTAGLDEQALRLRDVLAASSAAASAAPLVTVDAAPATNVRKRTKWTWSWWGWGGLCLSATGVASAAVGVGFFGYGATHPSGRNFSRDLGLIFVGIGAAAIGLGLPPLAVELHRIRKHRTRRSLSFLPIGSRHSAGVTMRMSF